MSLNTVKTPTIEQLDEIATELGFTFDEADLAAHHEALAPAFEAYNRLDQMPDELPPVTYPRLPGRRPAPEENRYGAWYVKTEIEGAATGKLKGKRVALKDNICLAGVPMMNGASTMEGYVPDVDATVAARILDAGGTIAGKTVCEYFCFSGGSHTSATGPVHNPHRTGYSAGGSSSGSAAVVASGEVPMALGGDQGGSIRIPASFCGIYGLKPTHGLVPYTGIMPIELTLDHTGSMTATVEDNALLLEVLAGPDGLDPRQYGAAAKPYREALGRGTTGLRIAIVEEGFGHQQSLTQVDAVVGEAAERLRGLGATVDTVSVPMHRLGPAIWLPIAAEGALMQMMLGNGFGFNWQGLYVTSRSISTAAGAIGQTSFPTPSRTQCCSGTTW
jgi:amidase